MRISDWSSDVCSSDLIGENHFNYYVNNVTRSGRCFYMMCDEKVAIADLKRVSTALEKPGAQVYGQRIDWFYNIRARQPTCLAPKAFRAGTARYDQRNLPDTLSYNHDATEKCIVAFHNFQNGKDSD